MTEPTFSTRPADRLYAENGVRVMLAPNRYRKLFGGASTEVSKALLGEQSELVAVASHGVRLLALGADHPAFATALEMQRAEWPHLAHLALGMEPHINLHDEVLLWRDADAR